MPVKSPLTFFREGDTEFAELGAATRTFMVEGVHLFSMYATYGTFFLAKL